MEVKDANRAFNAFLAMATLVVLGAGLGWLMALATGFAEQAHGHVRTQFGRLAWIAMMLLSLDVVVMFWLVIRFFSGRGRSERTPAPTPYVDAWAVAGKRLRVVQDGDGEGDEDGPAEENEKPE